MQWNRGPRGYLRSAVSVISLCNGAGAMLFGVLFLGTCPCFIAIDNSKYVENGMPLNMSTKASRSL